KAVIVGMSKGSVDAASALASGAKPAGVVIVSGIHARVMATLGSPDRLPATLVVHHSRDVCKFTLPVGAQQFVAWSRGQARLHCTSPGGGASAALRAARGALGFSGRGGRGVAAIVAFFKPRGARPPLPWRVAPDQAIDAGFRELSVARSRLCGIPALRRRGR